MTLLQMFSMDSIGLSTFIRGGGFSDCYDLGPGVYVSDHRFHKRKFGLRAVHGRDHAGH